VIQENKFFGDFTMPLSGDHNIRNALAAIGAAYFYGLTVPEIRKGLLSFKSIKKRLEIRAIINDITIYDDFAHHPTEVKTTIEGLRHQYPSRKIWAIFEPRTSTTKRKVMEKSYAEAFDAADVVILAPLHLPHKVKEEERLSVESLITQIKNRNKDAHYIKSINQIVNYTINNAQPKDLLLIMSNGAFGGIHDLLIERLSLKEYGK